MRVAVCLSGFMRGYERTAASWMENVIRPLDADVFISTWDTRGWREKSKHPDRHADGAQIDSELINLDDVKERFNATRVRIDQYSAHEPIFRKRAEPIYKARDKFELRNDDQPKANLSMYFQIWNANRLKRIYEADNEFVYDVVIRSRPDLTLNGIPEVCLEPVNPKMPWEILWSETSNPGCNAGELNDSIFVGTSENINWMCDIHRQIDRLFAEADREEFNILLQPHRMWNMWVTKGKIESKRIDMNARISQTEKPNIVSLTGVITV